MRVIDRHIYVYGGTEPIEGLSWQLVIVQWQYTSRYTGVLHMCVIDRHIYV